MEIEGICGGATANSKDFKFRAKIVEKYKCAWEYSVCGGTLITTSHVLTAAHCIVGTNVKRLKVIVGGILQKGTDGVMYSIRKLKIHEDYRRSKKDYDIGIIVVSNFCPIRRFFFQIVHILIIEKQSIAVLLITVSI